MMRNIVSLIFSSKYLDFLLKLSQFLFFCGILLAFAFPILNEHTFITEEQLKNTPLHEKDITRDFCKESQMEYLYSTKENSTNDILNFCNKIFYESYNKKYNHIFTKEILAPRGEKYKFIQINLIYDQKLNKTYDIMRKANSIFYTLLKFYSNPNNIPWLSRDMQINYITKELFYEHPKECLDLLANGKKNKKISFGQKISCVLNFDLSEFDVDNFSKFLFKIHGINSEQIDMDFYKMIHDNFITTFRDAEKFTTNEDVIPEVLMKTMKKIFKIFCFFLNKISDQKIYPKYYLFLINNILNNFFMINNKINTNHLLISRSENSILIKIIPKNNNIINNHNNNNLTDIAETISNSERNFRYIHIIGDLELTIKGISRDEIDLFRGQYFYILIDPVRFVGYYYLYILTLVTFRCFYQLIWNIYSFENRLFSINKNRVNAKKIILILFLLFFLVMIIFLNIRFFVKVFKINEIIFYYAMIGIIFTSQFFAIWTMNLNINEEKLINGILMFIFTLNCWNFIFINVGIGLAMTIIIIPIENLFIHLTNIKYNIFKIILVFIIITFILSSKSLMNSMLENFVLFENNVYIIISITLFFLCLRIILFLFMIFNKIKRANNLNQKEEIFNENLLCNKGKIKQD